MSNRSSVSVKEAVARGIARRYRNERVFRALGLMALLIGLGFLAFFFYTLVGNGYTAIRQTRIQLDVTLDAAIIDPDATRAPETLRSADYQRVAREALGALFPDVTSRADLRALYALLSPGAAIELQELVVNEPNVIGETRTMWLLADDDVDVLVKGHASRDAPEADRRIDDRQLRWLTALEDQGRVDLQFNRYFFTRGDSRDPELAGIWGATVGSFFMLLVTLALSFPLGVATAIYLEEFAPRNRWTDLIEVNINNLAAVPSIVFGLLGLALFINLFGLPRSAPLVGGLVLSLMTLPVIIIASRAALDGRAAVDSRGRARARRLEDADGPASRIAARDAGHADRHDHRHGARARRVRPAAHDRHGGVHRRRSGLAAQSRNGFARAGLSLGR